MMNQLRIVKGIPVQQAVVLIREKINSIMQGGKNKRTVVWHTKLIDTDCDSLPCACCKLNDQSRYKFGSGRADICCFMRHVGPDELRRAFRIFDSDRSGGISYSEFDRTLRKRLNLRFDATLLDGAFATDEFLCLYHLRHILRDVLGVMHDRCDESI